MKREFLQSLKVGNESLPKEVIDAIMEENGKDVQAARAWQEKYNQAIEQHAAEFKQLEFQRVLEQAIAQSGGRNSKAICALLDLEALKNSENQMSAVEEALENLKKESDYLFCEQATPPLYARGTGAQIGAQTESPATLAGALREKYERK